MTDIACKKMSKNIGELNIPPISWLYFTYIDYITIPNYIFLSNLQNTYMKTDHVFIMKLNKF